MGDETFGTAGHETFGFSSMYVKQGEKVKMKRRTEELFKSLEVSQKMSESRAEFQKQIASNLGYSTAQANVGGALSSIQGLAKQASTKAIDARFNVMEQSAKRANSISSAKRAAIMAAGSMAGSVFMSRLIKRQEAKGVGSKSRSRDMFTGQATRMVGEKVLNLAVVGLFNGLMLSKLVEDRNGREEDTKVKKESADRALGNAASGSDSERLGGLERRALSAQFTSANIQEMQSVNDLITEVNKTISNAVVDLLKSVLNAMEMKVNEKANKNKSGGEQVGDVQNEYLEDMAKAGDNTDAIKAAKAKRNTKMEMIAFNLGVAPDGLTQGGKNKTLRQAKKELSAKNAGKASADLDKAFDYLTLKMIEHAEKAEQSHGSDTQSFSTLSHIANNPMASPEDRKKAQKDMLQRMPVGRGLTLWRLGIPI